MANYRLARLTPEQMQQLEQYEEELGLTLIAWAPAQSRTERAGFGGGRPAPGQYQLAASTAGEEGAEAGASYVLEALQDTYRVHDQPADRNHRNV